MTDGIIQQVFKSWEIQSIDDDKNTIVYLIHDQIRKREKRIMRELIEKIKQEFPDIKGYSQYSWTIRQTLIGDNQE